VLSASTFAVLAVSALGFAPAPGRRCPTALAAMTPLSANGKKMEFAEGSSLMAACTKLGLKVPTNCKKVRLASPPRRTPRRAPERGFSCRATAARAL
jgi:hypothetical protein